MTELELENQKISFVDFLKEHAIPPESNNRDYFDDEDNIDHYIWDDYVALGQKVKKNENKYSIITLLTGDDGCIYAADGYHYVNRIGYIMTDCQYDKIINNDIKITWL